MTTVLRCSESASSSFEGQIARESIYVAEGGAPKWRAQWRSAP